MSTMMSIFYWHSGFLADISTIFSWQLDKIILKYTGKITRTTVFVSILYHIMFTSVKYSFWFLKIGLVAVFLWFGFDKFIHPTYWLNAWVPAGFVSFLGRFGLDGSQFVFLLGVFEILVGISLLTSVLTKFFSFLAIIFLVAVFFIAPFNEVVIRDFSLIGGLLAVLFWPHRRRAL